MLGSIIQRLVRKISDTVNPTYPNRISAKFTVLRKFLPLLLYLILALILESILAQLLFSAKAVTTPSDRTKSLFVSLVLVLLLRQIRPHKQLARIRPLANRFWLRFQQLYQLRVLPVLQQVHQNLLAWKSNFLQAPPKQKWKMVRKPIISALLLASIITVVPIVKPPTLQTSFPGNQGSEVPLDSQIELIFSNGVNRAFAEQSLSITPTIEGTFSWESDQKLIFTPSSMLERGTTYTLSFSRPILSKYFIPILGLPEISFETIGNPKVILASPQTEAQESASAITVVFDRPMIPLTTATNSAVKKPAFEVVPEIAGEGRWLGTTAYQFRPTKDLSKATTYTVTVPAGLRSQDGGLLQKEYSWEFSSERPKVVSISPARAYQYASPTASISATFSQKIDPKSAQEHFVVVGIESGTKMAGRIVVSGQTVGFYPSTPLARNEGYQAIITQGLKSLEGENPLEEDYTWKFGVAGKPAVVSSNPKNGAEEVANSNSIEVKFATPMDRTSFEGNVFIDPQPEFKPSLYFSSYQDSHSLSIMTYLGRSQTYTVTIGPNVKDQYGVSLGSAYTFRFTTAPYKPSVSIKPSGTYFGAFNQEVVPRIVAQVTNATEVEYSLYSLSRDDFLNLYTRRYGEYCSSERCRNWQDYDPSNLKKIKTWKETYEADLNTPVHVITKVTAANGDNIPPGFYFLDLTIPDGARDNMVMIVSKSTLTVKQSDTQIFVWAVNQSTADVIPNMNIEVLGSLGKSITSGTTNKDGVYMQEVAFNKQNNFFVFGEKDGDVVVAASAWSQGINRYDFGLPSYYDSNEYSSYYAKQDYKMFLTTDRPLYRPNQTVYFKGVVKKDSDGAYENLTPDTEVAVTINDSQGRPIHSDTLTLNSFGSFSGEFLVGEQAPLGYYQMQARLNSYTATQQFQVEEYKKPELAVDIQTSKPSYTRGETVDVSIDANYYFGAPVTEAPVTWTLQTQDYSFRWDKDWRFEFGDPDSYWSQPWWDYRSSSYYDGKKVTEGKGTTDGKGGLSFSLPINLNSYATSQKMMIEATVNDINNQSIASSREFTVHKAALYAGLRPESYGNKSGSETKVEVVVVDLQGKETPNATVQLEMYRRTWETVREKDPNDGRFYYVSKPSDELVASTSVTTNSLGRATGSFVPERGGTYKVVGKVTDQRGNQNTSGTFLWVSGYGFSAAKENNDRIVVVTDKRDYLVGEDLSVFVASPFASESAKTLLTLERGSVLDYSIVDTNDTSNNFSLPIKERYTPNAFVGAVLVRGGNQVKKPAEFKMGYAEVKVTDKKQQVDVAITTDKSKYKPQDTLKAKIKTTNKLGEPVSTEVAIGLVDKAVWDMSNLDFPDIYKKFYQPRNLDVLTSQLLTISIDRINANTNLGAKGGSGGGCFTGDTPILMADGWHKNIRDVRVGDTVLTKKTDTSPELVPAQVVQTFAHTVDDYLIINGELKVTSIHRMLVNGEWQTAGEIQIGDSLVDVQNQPVFVTSIERVTGSFEVYNLEIATYRTYFAGGIYVHNEKGGNDTSRSDFPDTAYWNPTVTTDANGNAEVSIPLPDNLTTWRLAAIAHSREAAFGSSTSDIVVNRDVLIRPFMPRFLLVGDKAQLGAIVVNTSGQTQTLQVRMQAEGLSLSDASTKEITLTDGSQSKVLWNTTALSTDSAQIKLSISSNATTLDAMETTIPVKPIGVPETVATSGQADDTAEETIVLPSDIDATRGEADVSFTPSLGGDSLTAYSHVLEYPYSCTEQITSRFMPAVYLNRILKSADLESNAGYSAELLSEVITTEIQALTANQHADGGWGWWTGPQSSPFLTAYAYEALVEAKRDGFTIADETLEKAKKYLRQQVVAGDMKSNLNTQAYILYVLRSDDFIISYTSNLYQRRFELSLEARAHLAMAMRESRATADRAKRITEELLGLAKKTATTTHWEEPKNSHTYMGSNTTTTSTVLELLTQRGANNPLIPEVVRYLLSTKVNGHWQTTRDTAMVLKAISKQLLAKGDEKIEYDYKLELNGKTLQIGAFSKSDLLNLESYAIDISDFTIGGENKFRISKSGTGNLYYNINLNYFLPFSEIEPLEQGLVVIREFVDQNGRILPKDSISENTQVWVRLLVVAPEERHYVAIEDFLPAGFESVNESLKTSDSVSANQPQVDDGQDANWLYFEHKEYRDDRTALFASYLPPGVYEFMYRVRATTPGTYQHPPAQAYQMYVPDISGHSDGGWLTID